jgi:glutathione S-transferase
VKLYYSTTSPYVRKVRIAAIEKGLASRIELIVANPWPDPAAIVGVNPLGKVPALVTDDGLAIYDSPVICEYLDSLAPEPRLVPVAGPHRWQVLRMQALADGILDAAVSIVLEQRRPEAERSTLSQKRAADAIRRGVHALGRDLGAPHADLDLGHIAAGVALGYLEFRVPDLDLGAGEAGIRDWWAIVAARPSFASTVPA